MLYCNIYSKRKSHILDDFKPASVDSTEASELIVGSNGEVTVKVPHIQVGALLLSVVDVFAWCN